MAPQFVVTSLLCLALSEAAKSQTESVEINESGVHLLQSHAGRLPAERRQRARHVCGNAANVWLLVIDESQDIDDEKKAWMERLKDHSPICVEVMQRANKQNRSFWETKTVAVHDYLLNHDKVELAVVTDSYDVFVNPTSWDEMRDRFQQLVARTPSAGIVIATEQSCWTGKPCSEDFVHSFRDRLRPFHPGFNGFINSQWMGTREAALVMLSGMLDMSPTSKGYPVEPHPDDQKMLLDYLVAHPDKVIPDKDELIFASMARLRTPVANTTTNRELLMTGVVGMCSSSNGEPEMCGFNWKDPREWGDCKASNGSVSVIKDGMPDVTPIIFHFNGHAKTVMQKYPVDPLWEAFAGVCARLFSISADDES